MGLKQELKKLIFGIGILIGIYWFPKMEDIMPMTAFASMTLLCLMGLIESYD